MTISRRAVVAAVLLLAAVAVAVALWPRAAVRLAPDDAAVVAHGRTGYASHCAHCHGIRLEGQPDWQSRLPNGRLPAPPHDAGGHTWHHPDELLFTLTREGLAAVAPPGYESDMPAFREVLSDRDIVAVLSFIKSTWPADIRRRHDGLNRSAERRG